MFGSCRSIGLPFMKHHRPLAAVKVHDIGGRFGVGGVVNGLDLVHEKRHVVGEELSVSATAEPGVERVPLFFQKKTSAFHERTIPAFSHIQKDGDTYPEPGTRVGERV